jgi:hypothetical protein
MAEESMGRVLKTKKLKHDWRAELNKLESKDEFKLDYSKPEDVIIGKLLNTNDAKSDIKSNVKFVFKFSGKFIRNKLKKDLWQLE